MVLIRPIHIHPSGVQNWFANPISVVCEGRFTLYCSTLAVYVLDNDANYSLYRIISLNDEMPIVGLAVSPNIYGLIALATKVGDVLIYDVTTGERKGCIPPPPLTNALQEYFQYYRLPAFNIVTAICWDQCPTSNYDLAIAYFDGRVNIWSSNPSHIKLVDMIQGPTREYYATNLSFNPRKPGVLAVGNSNGEIKIFPRITKNTPLDPNALSNIQNSMLTANSKSSACFHLGLDNLNATKSSTSSVLNQVKMDFDIGNGEESKVDFSEGIADFAWDPLSTFYILVAYKNGTILLWDAEEGCSIVTSQLDEGNKSDSWSGLMSSTKRPKMLGKLLMVFERQTVGTISSIKWMPWAAGSFAVSNNRTGMLKIFNVSQNQTIDRIRINAMDGIVGFIFMDQIEAKNSMNSLRGKSNEFAGRKKRFATKALCASMNGSIYIYDVKQKNLVFKTTSGHTETIFAITMNPSDPDILVTASYDGTIRLWHTSTMQPIKVLFNTLGIRKQSLTIKSSGMKRPPSALFVPPQSIIYSLAWQPNGEILVAGTNMGHLTIWNTASDRLLARINAHSNQIFCLRFSSFYPYDLASVGADGNCIIYDLDPDVITRLNNDFMAIDGSRKLNEVKFDERIQRKRSYKVGGSSYGCSWSPFNAFMIAVTNSKGYIHVYDIALERDHPIYSVRGHKLRAFQVEWSPLLPGLLATSSDDCTVKVWLIPELLCTDGLSSTLSFDKDTSNEENPKPQFRKLNGDRFIDSGSDHEDNHRLKNRPRVSLVNVFGGKGLSLIEKFDGKVKVKSLQRSHLQNDIEEHPVHKGENEGKEDQFSDDNNDVGKESIVCVFTLNGHKQYTRALSWNTEIPWLLLSGSWDANIRLWDLRQSFSSTNSLNQVSLNNENISPQCMHTVVGHAADVYGLVSHPKRPFRYISSSRDTTLRTWLLDGMISMLKLHTCTHLSMGLYLSNAKSLRNIEKNKKTNRYSFPPIDEYDSKSDSQENDTSAKFLSDRNVSRNDSDDEDKDTNDFLQESLKLRLYGRESQKIQQTLEDFIMPLNKVASFVSSTNYEEAEEVCKSHFEQIAKLMEFFSGPPGLQRLLANVRHSLLSALRATLKETCGGMQKPTQRLQKKHTKVIDEEELDYFYNFCRKDEQLLCHEDMVEEMGLREAIELESVRMGALGRDGGLRREERLELAAKLHLQGGRISRACELYIELEQWEKALSLAPGVSYAYWVKLTKRYSSHLKNLDREEAAHYMLISGKSDDCIQYYEERERPDLAFLSACVIRSNQFGYQKYKNAKLTLEENDGQMALDLEEGKDKDESEGTEEKIYSKKTSKNQPSSVSKTDFIARDQAKFLYLQAEGMKAASSLMTTGLKMLPLTILLLTYCDENEMALLLLKASEPILYLIEKTLLSSNKYNYEDGTISRIDNGVSHEEIKKNDIELPSHSDKCNPFLYKEWTSQLKKIIFSNLAIKAESLGLEDLALELYQSAFDFEVKSRHRISSNADLSEQDFQEKSDEEINLGLACVRFSRDPHDLDLLFHRCKVGFRGVNPKSPSQPRIHQAIQNFRNASSSYIRNGSAEEDTKNMERSDNSKEDDSKFDDQVHQSLQIIENVDVTEGDFLLALLSGNNEEAAYLGHILFVCLLKKKGNLASVSNDTIQMNKRHRLGENKSALPTYDYDNDIMKLGKQMWSIDLLQIADMGLRESLLIDLLFVGCLLSIEKHITNVLLFLVRSCRKLLKKSKDVYPSHINLRLLLIESFFCEENKTRDYVDELEKYNNFCTNTKDKPLVIDMLDTLEDRDKGISLNSRESQIKEKTATAMDPFNDDDNILISLESSIESIIMNKLVCCGPVAQTSYLNPVRSMISEEYICGPILCIEDFAMKTKLEKQHLQSSFHAYFSYAVTLSKNYRDYKSKDYRHLSSGQVPQSKLSAQTANITPEGSSEPIKLHYISYTEYVSLLKVFPFDPTLNGPRLRIQYNSQQKY